MLNRILLRIYIVDQIPSFAQIRVRIIIKILIDQLALFGLFKSSEGILYGETTLASCARIVLNYFIEFSIVNDEVDANITHFRELDNLPQDRSLPLTLQVDSSKPIVDKLFVLLFYNSFLLVHCQFIIITIIILSLESLKISYFHRDSYIDNLLNIIIILVIPLYLNTSTY